MNCLSFLRLLLSGVIFLSFFSACESDKNAKNAPDVSHIPVEIKVQRFDRDIFSLDTARLADGLQALAMKYPDMLPLFAQNIIRDPTNPNETAEQAVAAFLRTPEIRHLFDTCQIVFPDLDWLDKDLTQLFKYYKFYFPQKPLPQVVAMISEYATDAFTAGDSLCGIGLDMFLGEDFRGYNPEIFPQYIRRQFKKEYIPTRLAKALAQNAMGDPPQKRLIDWMLYNGKILYVAECLLPTANDTMLMGYSTDQLSGCTANETEVWARILDQKLLYSTDFNNWRKMVTPSPNAPIVFQEAPGEIGSWVGWQIVKSYMQRNPKTTLSELAKLTDAQAFLEKAKYKPKRK